MSQSNKIFAFLFVAFVVFITQRGELPVYFGFLFATPKEPSAPVTPGVANVGTNAVSSVGNGKRDAFGNFIGDAAKTAAQAFLF